MLKLGTEYILTARNLTNSAFNQVARDIKSIDAEAKRSSKNLDLLGKAFQTYIGIQTAQALASLADASVRVNNQIKLVTDSLKEFNAVQEDLYRISNLTGSSVNDTAILYGKLARATEDLGINQQRTARITETITKLIAISGASVEAANGAIVQLGQGLAANRLSGQEFNSVIEQTPALARAIADGLDIPFNKLRDFANAGELTAEKVINALERMSGSADKQFGETNRTIGQSVEILTNSMVSLIGTINDLTGTSDIINTWANSFASAIDGITESIKLMKQEIEIPVDMQDFGSLRGYSPRELSRVERELRQQLESARESLKYLQERGMEEYGFFSGGRSQQEIQRHINMLGKLIQRIENYKKTLDDEKFQRNQGLIGLGSADVFEQQAARVRKSIQEQTEALTAAAAAIFTSDMMSNTEKLAMLQALLEKNTLASKDAIIAFIRPFEELKTAINSINTEVQTYSSNSATLTANISSQIEQTDAAAKSVSELAKELREARDFADQYAGAIIPISQNLDDAAIQFERFRDAINSINTEVETYNSNSATFTANISSQIEQTDAAAKSVSELAKELREARDFADQYAGAIIPISQNLDDAAIQFERFRDAINSINTEVETYSSNSATLTANISFQIEQTDAAAKSVSELAKELREARDFADQYAGAIIPISQNLDDAAIQFERFRDTINSINFEIVNLNTSGGVLGNNFNRSRLAMDAMAASTIGLKEELSKLEPEYVKNLKAVIEQEKSLQSLAEAQREALETAVALGTVSLEEAKKISDSFDIASESIDEMIETMRVAQRSAEVIFQGMEDALVDFVTTGKTDFQDLANSIIRDLIRIQIQANVTDPFRALIASKNYFVSPSGAEQQQPAGAISGPFPDSASSRSGGRGSVTYNIDARGADPSVNSRIIAGIQQASRQGYSLVKEDLDRNGQIRQTIRR